MVAYSTVCSMPNPESILNALLNDGIISIFEREREEKKIPSKLDIPKSYPRLCTQKFKIRRFCADDGSTQV